MRTKPTIKASTGLRGVYPFLRARLVVGLRGGGVPRPDPAFATAARDDV